MGKRLQRKKDRCMFAICRLTAAVIAGERDGIEREIFCLKNLNGSTVEAEEMLHDFCGFVQTIAENMDAY